MVTGRVLDGAFVHNVDPTCVMNVTCDNTTPLLGSSQPKVASVLINNFGKLL